MPFSRRSFTLLFFRAALLLLLAAMPSPSLADDDLFEAPQAAAHSKAALTIFYNAESAGEMHPCPT